MFERFTDRARQVLVLAQEEARLLNHSFIGTEHILLGLIDEAEGMAAKALERLGIELEDVRERVEETIGLTTFVPTGSPPFTPRAKKVLELSLREALQMGHNYIGTEHLLLGIVSEGEGVGAQVLVSLGADLVTVRQTVLSLLSGKFPEVATTTTTRNVVLPLRSARGELFTGHAKLVGCSFCGRRPPDTGQLVSGNDAFICEHCIAHWARSIGKFEPGTGLRHFVHRFVHIEEEGIEPTGPPPEDEDAARAAIEAAFAGHGKLSDDGQSLPMVEEGGNLGPTLRTARERHRSVPEDAVIVTKVDEVMFIDAEVAAVWFTISADERPLLHRRRGDAVLVEGRWKMARSTFCDLMGLAGVECPPPTH